MSSTANVMWRMPGVLAGACRSPSGPTGSETSPARAVRGRPGSPSSPAPPGLPRAPRCGPHNRPRPIPRPAARVRARRRTQSLPRGRQPRCRRGPSVGSSSVRRYRTEVRRGPPTSPEESHLYACKAGGGQQGEVTSGTSHHAQADGEAVGMEQGHGHRGGPGERGDRGELTGGDPSSLPLLGAGLATWGCGSSRGQDQRLVRAELSNGGRDLLCDWLGLVEVRPTKARGSLEPGGDVWPKRRARSSIHSP